MKKSIFLLAVAGLLFIFLAFSCSKKDSAVTETPVPAEAPQEEAVTETEDLAPVEAPESHQGLVTFFSGDVSVFDEGEWWDIQIGDFLEVEDILKTGADAYCEIQFGDTAVVRVQENTELAMRTLKLSPGEADVGLNMAAGSVLTKVQKLGGGEKFKIQTQTAVCGVRGTEFSVTSGVDNKTVLAVKEGAVAVLPANVDVDKLREKVKGKGADVEKIIDDIEDSAMVVQANQQIDVDETTVQETEEMAKEVEKVVEEIAESEEETVDLEKIEVLTKAVEKSKENIAQNVKPAKEVSKENSEKLKEIDTMEMIEIPAAKDPAPEEADGEGEAETEEEPLPPPPALYKFSLKVEPEDARIQLNGSPKGKGSFSGIYKEGTELSFEFSREGFFEHSMTVQVSQDTNKLYRVKLAKIPEPEPEPEAEAEAEPEAEPEPEPITERITISVSPANADIYLDGNRVGKGQLAESYEVGQTLSFTVRQSGYEEQTLEMEITEGMEGTRNVSLVKIPAEVRVRISVTPRDAEVFINGESRGAGSYSGRHKEGESLSVSISKDGYEGESLSLDIGESDISRDVSLAKMVEPPKEVQISISSTPKDAQILLNGQSVGTGSYTGTHLEGSALSFSFRRKGYEEGSLSLAVSDQNLSRSVSLKPLPVYARVKASSSKIVGKTSVAGGISYSADTKGTVVAVDMEGNTLWSVPSKNSPNENSFPVVIGNYVYFSGARELVVINGKTGAVTGTRALSGDTSHMFGRRVVELDGKVLLPGNSSIHVLDAASGNTREELTIPGGSRMTPAIWNGKIIIVDQKGTMLIMNGSDGKVEAEIPTGAVQPVALSAAVDGNMAYFAGRKGTVVCVDLSAKKVVWERELSAGNIFTDLETGSSGVLAFVGGTIYWLDKNSGKNVSGPISGAMSPPLLSGRNAYFGGSSGLMRAAAGSSSAVVAVRTGTPVTSRPAAAGSRVAAGAENGEILIMNP